MPTQEVPGSARPAMLGRPERRPLAVLFDGGGPDSWGDGRALYSDAPCATLEVFASGWGRWHAGGRVQWCWDPPLAQWQRFVDGAAAQLPAGADRSAAGIATVLGYDLKHWIERLPRRLSWPAEPVLYSALYDWHYGADYRSGRAWINAASRAALAERLGWFEHAASAPVPSRARPPRLCPRPGLRKAEYLRMVERAQEYIRAGDIYQVNLAQRFAATGAAGDGAALFAAWHGAYPMPFAAYVDGGDWRLVSNSPECLLAVDGNRVATFPIKGTRPTGAAAAQRPLASDPKERAEHVMIVDLERNDLGRVCEPGSVEVAGLAAVRPFPLLEHMVSEVRGRLRPGVALSELISAVFPGGSVTGAPKIRAMQIIEELEPCARGLYTGAIGWTSLDGHSRFNLAIRTAVLTAAGLGYHAGGGIVADSDPEREYAETWLKAESLLRALAPDDGAAPVRMVHAAEDLF